MCDKVCLLTTHTEMEFDFILCLGSKIYHLVFSLRALICGFRGNLDGKRQRKIIQCTLYFTVSYLLDIPNESRKAPINFLSQKEKKMAVPRILGYNSLSTNPDTIFLRENTI